MAQSALTVTPPSPTPPTNMSFTGATPPNVPNFTKTQYANPFNMDANGRPQAPYGVNQAPPPYFAAGAAGALNAYAAVTAALASGTGATSGGTEGSYPGTDTAPIDTVNAIGAVPASTSVAHEEVGNVTTVTNLGNIAHSYPGAVVFNTSQMVSDGPALTPGTLPSPNTLHASSLSPAVNPTFSSFTAGSSVSGVGTTTLSCVTVGATKQSVVYVNGVAQTTVFVSSTSLTCAAVTKKATAGNWDIKIVTGGVVETAPRTWTFT